MVLLVIVLLIIIMLLVSVLILYTQEVRDLLSQLEEREQGSRTELTANVGNKDFIALYRRLNSMFETIRLKEKKHSHAQKQLKQTISNIAHDIRTPLTSAAGYLQMLEGCTTQEKQLRYERIIGKRIEELRNMLEELFLYTKLTSDEFCVACKSIAVYPVLSECMIGLYHEFEEKGIAPDICITEEEICVMANEECLGRIFRNLIHNALLHGEGGLRVVQEGNVFSFANRVKHTQLIDTDKIFDRFYKADKSRQKGTSGLGLAIVKELVERMGGSIEAAVNKNDELEITVSFQAAAKT